MRIYTFLIIYLIIVTFSYSFGAPIFKNGSKHDLEPQLYDKITYNILSMMLLIITLISSIMLLMLKITHYQQCYRLKLFGYTDIESFNQNKIQSINRKINSIKKKYDIDSDDVSKIKKNMIIDIISKNKYDISDINNWTFEKLENYISK